MSELLGIKVIASPLVRPVPNFRLSPDVPLSDGFRAEMQEWLNDFFGMREVCYVIDSSALQIDISGRGGTVVAINPKMAAMLRGLK